MACRLASLLVHSTIAVLILMIDLSHSSRICTLLRLRPSFIVNFSLAFIHCFYSSCFLFFFFFLIYRSRFVVHCFLSLFFRSLFVTHAHTQKKHTFSPSLSLSLSLPFIIYFFLFPFYFSYYSTVDLMVAMTFSFCFLSCIF